MNRRKLKTIFGTIIALCMILSVNVLALEVINNIETGTNYEYDVSEDFIFTGTWVSRASDPVSIADFRHTFDKAMLGDSASVFIEETYYRNNELITLDITIDITSSKDSVTNTWYDVYSGTKTVDGKFGAKTIGTYVKMTNSWVGTKIEFTGN